MTAFSAWQTSNPSMATAEALQRRARRRARRKLLLEAIGVLSVTAIGALVVYLVYRHPVRSPWKVAGENIQNVSRQDGIQTEVAVAVDPSDPRTVFAASNESLEPEIRVYASRDGGGTWARAAGPTNDPNTCAWGDPAVAIARNGREYVAFTQKSICAMGPDLTPYLVVASRRGVTGKWVVSRVTRPAVAFGFDDKPAISVGGNGRVYVAWSRLLGRAYQTTVVSSSSDGGRTWSKPQVVSRRLTQPQLVTVAAGPSGTVYLAGVDARGLWVARSADRGRHFTTRTGVAPLPGSQAATCIVFGKYVLPQQAVRCLGPNPTLVLGRNRVYVTYGVNGRDGTQDVAVAVFDRSLHSVGRSVITPSKKKADEFWPAAAFDGHTGKLWVCFYDTTGDSDRRHAWFTCTSSRDERRWTTPVRATSDSANPGVLWEDARIYGYGDSGGYGGYPGVAAAGGKVYALWIDTRDVGGLEEEVFGATLR
jgi:hypothetical protein